MTVADLTIAVLVTMLNNLMGIQVSLDKFPKIKALKERVEAKPRVAQYLANRK